MIKIIPITTANQALYEYMERLLTASFPENEYRTLSQLRKLTDADNAFVNQIVQDDNQLIGLLTAWDFGDFIYLEHFATDPTQRNKGYGKRILETWCSQTSKPLVLEVEEPIEEMAKRRIGFYQRNGFTLWEKPYQQPPYKSGDSYLPMRLMVRGNLNCEQDYERIKNKIYQEVYGV